MKVCVTAHEDAVAAIGAARHGAVTAPLLADAGVPPHVVKYLRRRGVLLSVGRGVDRLRDHPLDLDSRCQLLLDIAGPGAALGLRTAARRLGCYSYRSADEVEVLVTRGRDHRCALGRIVQTRVLPPHHVTSVDGFPVTTLARTFFDLCADPEHGLPVHHPAHEKAMARVYNDALARRGLRFTHEAAVLAVLAKRGRTGTRLVRTLLQRFGPEHEPTRSDAESLFMELVWAYGLPEPEKQVSMSDVEGFIGVVDFLWRDSKLVVEIDSSWHDGPLDVDRDIERDERLRAAGYTVRRYRYGQLIGRPAAIARELGVVTSNSSTGLPPERIVVSR